MAKKSVESNTATVNGEIGGRIGKLISPKKPEPMSIELPRMKLATIRLRLIGDSPLLCNKWSEKAIQMMLDKQMKKAKGGKEAKDPDQCFRDSLYRLGDGYGFPAIAFKACAVDACSFVDGMTKVEARGAFHVNLGQELVPITGKPEKHQAMVRVGMGVADIRFRGIFPKWSAEIEVKYNECALSAEQITNLFNIAGFAIGVGEHRPQKDGQNGMFHVASHEEMVD